MARLIERKFDPARPTYARKYFTAAGRKFVPNDLFDWQKLAVSQRRAMQMFDAGKLTHKDKDPAPKTPKSVEVTAKDKALQDLADTDQYWDADENITPERKTEEVTPERKPLESLDYYEVPIISEEYDLDAIDDLKALRAIADEIGAPYKVSKADQREAIRAHRKEMNNG